MHILFIITSDDAETVYNAMRLANTGIKKGDDISVFMLGRALSLNPSGMKPSRSAGKSTGSNKTCPIGWMDDLDEIMAEADMVVTF